tara:strand:+ start:760 stop:1539 length:780 start_codon:yes stop_codon:yes gene_type:complete
MQDELEVGAVTQRIPKKIHVVWPHDSWCDTFSICVDRMTKLHPDWEVKVWKLDDLPDLHCQNIIDGILQDDLIAFAASFIGMQLIVRYGGVALDPDTFLFRSIEPLTYSTRRCVVMRHYRYYGSHMMGCEPHDPYFSRAISAMPDFYGTVQNHPIPNDIFTAAKLFYFIEDCSSHMKTNLRPTAHHCLALPESAILSSHAKSFKEKHGRLPSYIRGVRVVPDYCKYHNQIYGNGTETYLEGAESHLYWALRDYGYADII